MPPAATGPKLLHLGPRVVDLASGRVDGPTPSRLTGLEVALLDRLARAGDQAVGRESLLQEAWGYPAGHSWRAVDAAIYRLRKKIEDDPNDPRWLLTVRGGGYRLVTNAPAVSADRAAERAALAAAIRSGGLVSVVGLPGVGRSWVVERALAGAAGVVRVDLPRGTDATTLLHLVVVAAGVAAQAAVDADGLRAALLAALGDGAGKVVVLEDADGAPEARELARGLVAACPRIAVVLVADASAGVPGETVVAIPPLDPAGARAFLLPRLPARISPDDPALDDVLARLGGLPLALALAADCLAWCAPVDLAAQLERGVALLELPARRGGRPGVSAVWRHAWEGLPAEGQAVLRALLPFHSPFPLAIAERLGGGGAVTAALDLVGRGWILRSEERGTYRVHPVLRAFLREAVGEGDLAGWVAVGAEAARRVPVSCGDFGRWRTRRALAETGMAGELLALALTAPPGPELAPIALAAEVWLDGRAEPGARRAVLDRALAVAALAPGERRGLEIARARLELGWGDWEDARRRLDDLLARVDGAHEPEARGWLLWYRHGGQIAGTGEEQLAAVRDARSLLPVVGDPVLEGILTLFGAVVEWQERVVTSIDAVDAALQRVVALMLGAGELSGAVYAELHRSHLLQESGRWAEAARARRRSGELDDASEDHLYRGGVLAHRALDRVLAHDLAGAMAAVREALAVDLAAGMTANRPFLHLRLAQHALDRGDLDEAERAAGASLAAARGPDGRRLVEAAASYVLAAAAVERGEVGAAVHLARGAVAAAAPREALLLGAVVAYGEALSGAGGGATAETAVGDQAVGDQALAQGILAAPGDRLAGSAAVWLVGARLARGDREGAATLLRAVGPLEVVPDYGGVLLDRLWTAAGAPPATPASPPPGAPPPDARSVLLRMAGRWARVRTP